MTPRAPRLGDVVTTYQEYRGLPAMSVVLDSDGDPWGIGHTWEMISQFGPFTLVYDGHPPRPEREVKAEALREVASVLSPDEVVGPGWLEDRADRIARGAA